MSVTRTLAGPALGAAVAGVVLYSVGTSLSTRTHQVTGVLHSSSHSLRRLADVDDTRDLVRSAHIAPDTATMVGEVDRLRALDPATGADAGQRGVVRDPSVLPAAYRPLGSSTLTEQVKARWNVSPKREDRLEIVLPGTNNGAQASGKSAQRAQMYQAQGTDLHIAQSKWATDWDKGLAIESPTSSRLMEHVTGLAHALEEADIESTYASLSYFVRSAYARVTGGEAPIKPVSDSIASRHSFASALSALAPSAPQSAAATLREPVPPRLDVRLAAPNTKYLGQGASLRD